MTLRGQAAAALLVSAALFGGFGAHAQPRAGALRIDQRLQLPPASSVATDVRWGSDRSLYILWDRDGVAEISLDGSAKRREMVPHLKELGGLDPYPHYNNLAVSSSAVAVAPHSWSFLWRPLQAKAGQTGFQNRDIVLTNDFDLSGDRVVLLGVPQHDPGSKLLASKGAVGWTGTLSSGLKDLRPVLHDVNGAEATGYWNCRLPSMGAARFLPDGSFVIAPGFQDGIHLYGPGGRRVRSWTHEQIGVNTHLTCPAMTEQEIRRFRTEAGWQDFLNRHTVIDDILPLPQGAGVLVRSWGADQQARWTLNVLRPDGVKTFQIPITGKRPGDRLRGDVRNGQIVLLLSASGVFASQEAANLPAEIYILTIPK